MILSPRDVKIGFRRAEFSSNVLKLPDTETFTIEANFVSLHKRKSVKIVQIHELQAWHFCTNNPYIFVKVGKILLREGPSQERLRDTETEPAAFSSVGARTRATEEMISELRAEDARTPPLRSRRASIEVAGPPPVPAAVFMKLREENEREIRTWREALHNTETQLAEFKGALENLMTV
ncbi:hypothetical protein AVEN_104377-1 [Araneus ventricosus]|uniref:Uncharacterized protein n=1 Tax=Araneus ventricosus TaxID=182803 RepID=A0A4Y2MAY9_ARAVE|nr:hypothetical protein AVEN_104377-1 [Araneus ventricosus]